jgi:hypothetical protein
MNDMMIPLEYIVIFAMTIVEVLRKRLPESLNDMKPFIAFAIAIGCNLINALIFKGDLLIAGREAFISAGISLTLFSGGSAIGKVIATKTSAVSGDKTQNG